MGDLFIYSLFFLILDYMLIYVLLTEPEISLQVFEQVLKGIVYPT